MLHKIAKLVDLPDFVKRADLIGAKEVEVLPQHVFADQIGRKFPCHTKAATWLAQLYFLEGRHLYPTKQAEQIQARISNVANWWGIGGQTKQAAQAWETKQVAVEGELPDDAYALVVDYEGQKLRQWPITNQANVKAAAATLYRNRAKFPYDWRLAAARRILTKAAQLQVTDIEPPVHEYLTKAAGRGSAAPRAAAEAIARRMLMVPVKEKAVKTAAAKLAKAMAAAKGIPHPESMVKLARIVDRLDREQGFYPYYEEAGLEMPEEIFFELTEKKAQAFRDGHVSLQTGTIIPLEALTMLDLGKVAGILGDEFTKEVVADDSLDIDIEKFARIAATLPRGDAQLLERALASAGLKFEVPTLEGATK
jgi:hypothetical protein